MASREAPSSTTALPLEISSSRQFPSWLAQEGLSIVFSTYQVGKVFFVGIRKNGSLSFFERSFNRSMGLWGDCQTLYLSSLYQIWRFENALQDGQLHNDEYDCLYIPQVAYTTGDLDVHDVAVDDNGRVIFANTLFGCLSTTSLTHSHIPIWKPPFIQKLAPEDRCHLNGLAMQNGQPRYVTTIAQSDTIDGWRDHRRDGGCVIEVPSGEIVAQGLSMPHSPRVYKGRLWILNSGRGEFGYVDMQTQKFEPVCFCAGYLRGLAFYKSYALVGLSKPRGEKTFSGLPLNDLLQEKKAEARCAIYVIDLNTGNIIHWLRFEGIISELYDVVSLPGVRQPMAVGLKSDEIRWTMTIGNPQWL
ncbi:MAG: TIGR03032 family protein [Cyanobacteria bacterium P01_H01_bin.15]